MDTYVYPDKDYMARWVDAVHTEFPNFNIVGEVWVQTVPSTAYYTIDGFSRDGYKGTLRSVTDFPLYSAMTTSMWEDFGWSNGLSRVYYTLTQDFLYKDPRKNVIFLDNHDLWRFASHVNRDSKKYKVGLTMLLTLRGIPQVYYGTEIMLDASGPGNHDAVKRKDFPGGWAGDSVNKFVATGRTAQENEAFDFVKKLTTYRKTSPALQFGAMTHFVPSDNIYVYFRHTADQEVMVILNMDEKEKQVDLSRFSERLGAFSKGTDILSGTELSDLKTLTMQGRSSMVVELKK
jgi:neopullulanase